MFGGDLGRYDRPVLRDPDPVAAADVLLVESTYGDRRHEADDHGARFAAIVRETIARNGKVVIPAFAIGRVEEILYWLKQLEEAHADPGGACVRGQPDGGRGARVLRQAGRRARRRHARGGQAAGELRDAPVPDGVVGAAVGGAGRVEDAGGDHLGQRHGDGRTRAAPSQARAAGCAQHGALRRLSGGRHAGPLARRWRAGGEDPRPVRARLRAGRTDRLDVGPRRRRGDPALAARVHRSARR